MRNQENRPMLSDTEGIIQLSNTIIWKKKPKCMDMNTTCTFVENNYLTVGKYIHILNTVLEFRMLLLINRFIWRIVGSYYHKSSKDIGKFSLTWSHMKNYVKLFSMHGSLRKMSDYFVSTSGIYTFSLFMGIFPLFPASYTIFLLKYLKVILL